MKFIQLLVACTIFTTINCGPRPVGNDANVYNHIQGQGKELKYNHQRPDQHGNDFLLEDALDDFQQQVQKDQQNQQNVQRPNQQVDDFLLEDALSNSQWSDQKKPQQQIPGEKIEDFFLEDALNETKHPGNQQVDKPDKQLDDFEFEDPLHPIYQSDQNIKHQSQQIKTPFLQYNQQHKWSRKTG